MPELIHTLVSTKVNFGCMKRRHKSKSVWDEGGRRNDILSYNQRGQNVTSSDAALKQVNMTTILGFPSKVLDQNVSVNYTEP